MHKYRVLNADSGIMDTSISVLDVECIDARGKRRELVRRLVSRIGSAESIRIGIARRTTTGIEPDATIHQRRTTRALNEGVYIDGGRLAYGDNAILRAAVCIL